MNREELYLEIGEIDDELIQEAADARRTKNKKRVLYRAIAVAACLCVIFGSVVLKLQRDTVHINDGQALTMQKVVVPDDENIQLRTVTYQELLSYYGLAALPDVFGEDLLREEQSFFAFYQDQSGTVLFDRNIFYFSSADKSKRLSVALSKTDDPAEDPREDMQLSVIDGASVLIEGFVDADFAVYRAGFEAEELSVQILSEGLPEDEFIGTVKELIKILK